MHYEIKHGPSFSVLEIGLSTNESVVAQPNSLLSMTPGIDLKARVGRRNAGAKWVSGLKSMLGGESFFTTEFHANRESQSLILAPDAMGDILSLPLVEGTAYCLMRGAFLANVGDCTLKIRYGGLEGVLASKGVFMLHASGQGTVFCQTYGAILERTLAENEVFIVDNRYVVAFTDSVTFKLVKATKSMRDSMFSGEGLVNRYTGPGTIYYQTRSKPRTSWLGFVLQSAT